MFDGNTCSKCLVGLDMRLTYLRREWINTALIVLVAAPLGALLLLVVPSWRSRPPGPCLEVPACPTYLGKGRPGESLTGDFELTNVGRQALQFKIIPVSCSCASLDPAEGEIAPGKIQWVKVRVKLDSQTNWTKDVRLAIRTNDPQHPVVTYSVFAECPPPLRVSPAFLHFGEVSQSDLAGAQLVLTISDADGKKLPNPRNLRFNWGSKHLAVNTDTGKPDECRLRVSLLPGLPLGDTYDTVELRLAPGKEVVKVSVHVRLVQPILVVPSTVLLSVDPATGGYGDCTILVRSSDASRRIGRLASVDAPEGVRVTETGGSGGGELRLRLSVEGNPRWGPETKVLLRCDGISESIPITVVKPGSR